MAELELLNNPIWNSLRTELERFADGDGLARRFQPAIGPLSGTVDQSAEAYEALRNLAGPGGTVGLFLEEPPLKRPAWTLLRGGLVDQMVFQGPRPTMAAPLSAHAELRLLTRAEIPAMVELAELTEPGPFRNRTCELGKFFGIFESGRFVAMAGQRMRVPGFIEVSAVCTHPDARGRGYARILMSTVMDDIFAQDATPFLHVLSDNHSAIRVYEGLGFVRRCTFHLAVLKNQK
jgi:ribosomal protein S18 acetylase RimI-like enzyme